MSLETDVKAVGSDLAADAKAVVSSVKAEAEKVFASAKVEAVEFEGSVAQEITKLKDAVNKHGQQIAATVVAASKSDLAAVEAKIDAVIAKLGVKL